MAAIDFQHVEDKHRAIHERLLNWGRWVTPGRSSFVSPMFRQYRSNAWQWHAPEYRESCDILDGQLVEKEISKLPEPHREALRWCYVHRCAAIHACRALAVSYAGLALLVRDGRQMMCNRLDGGFDGSDYRG